MFPFYGRRYPPPVTPIVSPVTNDESSDASHDATPATSAGAAPRPKGVRALKAATLSAGYTRTKASCSTRPGAIALARMPYSANSIASPRVNAMTAALDACCKRTHQDSVATHQLKRYL